MRVLLIAMHFSEYSYRLAQGLAERAEVHLLVNAKNFNAEMDGVAWSEGKNLTVEILPHKRSLGVLLGNMVRLALSARRFKADVVHIQEEPKDYLLGALPFLSCRPIVLTVHDPVPHVGNDAKRVKWTRRGLYISALRRSARKYIVHGEMLKDLLAGVTKRSRGDIAVIPHGPLGPQNVELNNDWTPGNCLFFGRVEEYKGLGVLLDAFDILQKKGVPATLTIAGRGGDLARHKGRIAGNGQITLIEKYLSNQEVVEQFTKANVVVLPYIEGTQSGVAAYAIGLNRPVVVTRVGSIPDMVEDGVTGDIVEARNPQSLAAAIERLVSEQGIAKQYAANVSRLREGKLSWRQIAESTLAVYEQSIP